MPVARPSTSGKGGVREGALSLSSALGYSGLEAQGGCSVDDVLQLLRLLSTHRSRTSSIGATLPSSSLSLFYHRMC